MAQLGFFDERVRVVVDDASGSIVYHPHALAPDQAQRLFEALKRDIQWRHERRMMYDREVDVPRLVASLRYDDALPPLLKHALPLVEELSNSCFNSIGLNFYRDGHDSVAPHSDTIAELEAGYPIGLLSLGSTRRMTIRSKNRPRRVLDLDLEPGSLLVMSYQTQTTYDHAIPKTGGPAGPRISVAFRMRRASSPG